MTVHILLADDHPLIRQGLLRLLEAEPDMQVVGEASDGLQAVQLAEALKPDVLVLDLMMPGLNGLEVLRQVKKRLPATATLVLSMQSADAYVVEALKCGADGYILKDSGPAEVVIAVRHVVQGQRFLSAKLSEKLIDAYLQSTAKNAADLYETLTDREREVLQMAAEGLTNAAIARRLSLSPRTVELHRSRMMNKLGLHNHTELIRYAVRRGILPIDP